MRNIKAFYKKHILEFKNPAQTSRDTMLKKTTWYLVLRDIQNDVLAIGECSTIPGLSIDNEKIFELKLKELCGKLNFYNSTDFDFDLSEFPAIKCGFETAVNDLEYGGKRKIFNTNFYKGKTSIPINGLIWMGNIESMKNQLAEKIEQGFKCIKIKIGGLDFEEEINFLKEIRKEFSSTDLTIRLDANGALQLNEALDKIKRLFELEIHSIEQPIKAGNFEQMADLCINSPIDIALDEELIGVVGKENKTELLDTIKPAYIILKPSLLGGFQESNEWINLAKEQNVDWWATSALESNIGLNAIAQWISKFNPKTYQGLGTGSLYKNNIPSPLEIKKAKLKYDTNKKWDTKLIF